MSYIYPPSVFDKIKTALNKVIENELLIAIKSYKECDPTITFAIEITDVRGRKEICCRFFEKHDYLDVYWYDYNPDNINEIAYDILAKLTPILKTAEYITNKKKSSTKQGMKQNEE